ncbi:MAG: D-alanine--D-alanine ligase [Holosporales bacterium]|nr:D-alanine--D-alanine ligase [Holosporales bacterium]
MTKRIAVLMGGWSQEREISLSSGQNIARALKGAGYDVHEIDIERDLLRLTNELYACNPDFIFNALHGEGGEDGTIQGVLEFFGVPYSNSNVLGSSIAFDKAVCKSLVRANGVRVIDGCEVRVNDIQAINSGGISMEYPFVVKPATNGSSIGVFLIFNEQDLARLKGTNWIFGNKILLEKYVSGREFTVMILTGKAMGALEITYQRKFYDYKSKYEIGGSTHISSFELNEAVMDEMFKASEIAFDVCRCNGLARTDFIYDKEHVYFLEINTQPGMTELSLVPDIARLNGTSFIQLLEVLMQQS